MKTIEYTMLDGINFREHIYAPAEVFVTVLDSFVGHFDGKEYWTVRREKKVISCLNGEIREAVEIKTVCADDFRKSVESDTENIRYAKEHGFEKI